MAYSICFVDDQGKRYYGTCGDMCKSVSLGWFRNGEPIIVPASIDELLYDFDPYHSIPGWYDLSERTVVEWGLADERLWRKGIGKMSDFNGTSAFFCLIRLSGYAANIWDPMRGVYPGFDEAMSDAINRGPEIRCMTGSEVKRRMMAANSLKGGPMCSNAPIRQRELSEWCYRLAMLYSNLALAAVCLPGPTWEHIGTFGTAIHYICSSCMTALSELADDGDEDADYSGRLTLEVVEVPEERVRIGKAIDVVNFDNIKGAGQRMDISELFNLSVDGDDTSDLVDGIDDLLKSLGIG